MKTENEILKERIRKLENKLYNSEVLIQLYKDYLAEMRRNLTVIKRFLEYKPDKDKAIEKIIRSKI